MAIQTTPADLEFICASHDAGLYDRDSDTGEAFLRVPSTGEWITHQQVLALLADYDDIDLDDDDEEDGVEARIIEQGAGLAGVRVGAYVSGGGSLYRVARVNGTIHTNDSRGNYLIARVVEIGWQDEPDEPILQVGAAVDGNDGDDD